MRADAAGEADAAELAAEEARVARVAEVVREVDAAELAGLVLEEGEVVGVEQRAADERERGLEALEALGEARAAGAVGGGGGAGSRARGQGGGVGVERRRNFKRVRADKAYTTKSNEYLCGFMSIFVRAL